MTSQPAGRTIFEEKEHRRKNMSRFFLILIFLVGFPFAASGQSPLEKHDIHSLAILPMIGDVLPDTARELLADDLATQLQKQFSKVKIKTVGDTVSALKEAGRLNDLANLANLYTKVGVADSDTAGRIVKSLNVEGVLLINVQEYLAQKGKWSRGKSSYNSFRAQCYVLDSLGQPIWHHLVAYVHDPHPWLNGKADPASEVMEKAAERIVYALSKGIENSDPKKDIRP
jgi:hypothetical protein